MCRSRTILKKILLLIRAWPESRHARIYAALGLRPCLGPACVPLQLRALMIAGIVFVLAGGAWSRQLGLPLANDPCPTSSFGSWRFGHLHAGLDFSTGGVTGVPVLAVDSCRVWRVSVGNGGYGKALYAELADGTVAVYGHLSRFRPEIEKMVEDRQDREGKYEVEILFEPEVLAFARGDTLAFSGESGSGPPHLHFELRSGRNEHDKISPIPDYLNLAEASKPVIKAVRIEPLDRGTSINGVYGALTLRPARGSGELRISGPFGVSVEAEDPVQCGRVLAPVTYEALVDSVPVWALSLDRFPFAKSHFVGWLYEIIGGSKFVRMFDPYNLDLTGFSCREVADFSEAGSLVSGKHDLAVRVGDAWGNTDQVRLPFIYGTQPVFSRFRLLRDSAALRIEIEPEPRGCAVELAYLAGQAWHPIEARAKEDGIYAFSAGADSCVEVRCRLLADAGFASEGFLALGWCGGGAGTVKVRPVVLPDFVEIWGETSTAPSSLPVALVRGGGRPDSIVFQPAGRNVFRATYVPQGMVGSLSIETRVEFDGHTVRDTTRLALRLLEPGGDVWISGEHYTVRFHAPETYSSKSLITVSEAPGKVYNGFEAVDGELLFEPLDVFFGDRVDVMIVRKKGVSTASQGVFAESGNWAAFRGRFDANGRCEFGMRCPENLVILEDTQCPRIEAVADLKRRRADGKATFTSKVTDTGSGVDAGSLRAFVDDEPAIVSIDPDTGRIDGRTTKALPYGEHRIRLEAEDRLGNRASREFTVSLAG
jgi:hypothetical protein